MSKPDKVPDRFWDMPLRDLLGLLEATPDGLSSAAAKRRLRLHGPNSLVKESRFAALTGFLRFLANPLVLILLAASAISIVLRDPVGGSIIIAVPGDNVDPACCTSPSGGRSRSSASS